ncbi:MAG TPA: ThiF family adenylyltransferase [Alphaproteobacteria bacterium]|nr:ThiF family adenylyltransferase [Alphaproteobacteria bacterium]
MKKFVFEEAFDRTIGWVTADELQTLRSKRVAIAGLGGVGGYHLLTLLRLGVSNFNIAEMDVVEIANFNRQACAGLSHLGENKIDVMLSLAKDINPEADFRVFSGGVQENNIHDFLRDADLYIDGLDFFVLDIREKVFSQCWEMNIPAMTTAPLGMGMAHLNFIPGKMSFDEYFGVSSVQGDDRCIKFISGLAPTMLHRPYLVDMSRVDFAERKGPSTPMACELCARVAGTEALKILLGRGKVRAAPHGMQFDAYSNRFRKTWRPMGHKNPLQILLFKIIQFILSRKK